MKFEPGDTVVVHGKEGRGEGRVLGVDPNSGMVRIAYTKIEAEIGGKRQTLKSAAGAEGYAPGGQLTRE